MEKTSKVIKRVAFFGDGEAKSKDEHFVLAEKTAKLLAEAGYIIVNGGGPGVMKAATMGAKSGKGKVEVVILESKLQPDNYEGVDKENVTLADKIIKTNNYPDRLNKLVDIADAFVIFKGGTGTLSEVGLTWEMAKFDYGHHEPLIFVGDCWKEIVTGIIKNLNLEKMEQKVVKVVNKPEEVVTILKKISR